MSKNMDGWMDGIINYVEQIRLSIDIICIIKKKKL